MRRVPKRRPEKEKEMIKTYTQTTQSVAEQLNQWTVSNLSAKDRSDHESHEMTREDFTEALQKASRPVSEPES